MTRAQTIALILAGIGLLLAVSPPVGFSGREALAAGLALAAIGLWATGALPEALTALLFFAICMLSQAAPAKIVFSGFMSQALWLVFSGLVFGAAIKSTGFGDRVAHAVGRRMGHSFASALLGVLLMGLGLAFLMPSSMGRIVLMVPLLAALCQHLGYEPSSRGWNGLMLGGIFSTFLPSFSILPANIPNMVLSGAAEALLGAAPSYGDYFLANFPVLGLLKWSLLFLALWILYRGDEPKTMSEPPPKSMSASERKLALVLTVAIGLWMTDSLHHIAPGWVGLAAAILCLLPQTGILPPKSLTTINFEPVLYVAGVIGLGAVIDHAGVGRLVGSFIIGVLPLSPDNAFFSYMSLAALAAVVGMATTMPGVPAVLTPFAASLAAVTGLPVTSILMTQVAGFSTLILPYQAPPVMTGIQISHAKAWDFTRLGLILAVVSVLVLWPLEFLWLRLVGKM
ncbi:MAG: SLC13 family permease [Rhodospirillales bacterium]|jgi:anion transporter